MSNVSQPIIKSQDGFVPSKPIDPVTQGRSSGNAALPSSALATPALSLLATAITSSVACSAPAPTRIATFVPAFSASAARRKSASYGTVFGAEKPTPEWIVPCLRGWKVLQIVWEDKRRHHALAKRNAHSAIDEMANLRRRRRLLHKGAGNILEHALQVEFLLVVPAKRIARLLTGDRQNRHVIHARVIKPGHEMRCARSRRRHAYADLSGKFGVSRRHECRHFLMADLNEIEAIAGTVQRAEQAVDAVTGIAEDRSYAPLAHAFPKEIANGPAHVCSQKTCATL